MDGEFQLPPGYTIYPGTCQCGRALVQVDDIEGLPIYACVNRCGQKTPQPDETPPREELK